MIKKSAIFLIILAALLTSCSKNPQITQNLQTVSFKPDSIISIGKLLSNQERISRWDDLIKSASRTIGWDWRLLSSLIYQESGFDPDAVSWAGAFGLMQVMPATGKNYGIDITSSPSNNLKAGIKYIEWLQSIFETKVANKDERMKFILASYNAGPGHVLDAMKLAEKNGSDPQKWDGNVAVWLLKKAESRYFTDSVVKYGYFRGTESVHFVIGVLARYEHYKKFAADNPQYRLTLNSK